MIEITIPFKTPSVNHLYGQRGHAKFLTTEAKRLREKIKEIIEDNSKGKTKCINLAKKIPNDRMMEVRVEIHEDWLTKDGDVRRKDIANREKFLIDSVFNALGLDDKYIFEHTMVKVQDDKEEFSKIFIQMKGGNIE